MFVVSQPFLNIAGRSYIDNKQNKECIDRLIMKRKRIDRLKQCQNYVIENLDHHGFSDFSPLIGNELAWLQINKAENTMEQSIAKIKNIATLIRGFLSLCSHSFEPYEELYDEINLLQGIQDLIKSVKGSVSEASEAGS